MHNTIVMHPFPIMDNIVPAVGALIISTSGNTALVISQSRETDDGNVYSVDIQWCNKDKPTYLDVSSFNLMVKMKKWEYVAP